MVKCKFCYLLLLCVFMCLSVQLLAQSLADYKEGLALDIEDSDIRKMEKAVETVKEGLQDAEEVHKMYQELSEEQKNRWRSSGHKKVLRHMGRASEEVRDGHNSLYEIYHEYCEAFWETTKEKGQYTAGMNKAKYYERQAKKHITAARRNRDFVSSSENYERAASKFEKAMELEKLAIRDKGRALQIYQDFPVEYDYGWKDDVDDETVAKMFADKYVEEPEVNDEPESDIVEQQARSEGRVDTVVIKQVDTVYLAEKDDQNTNPIPDTIAKKEDLKWHADVIFKVQVAAHTEPISDKEISQIYKGNEHVNTVYEDNWYKYQIGPYDKYSDARRVLNETNVENAFVVPYMDGKKLTIEEALKKEAKEARE